MDFAFDQLDSTECPSCKGLVDVSGVAAFKVIPCPHCKADVRVPGKLGTLLLQEIVGVGSAGVVYKALDATLHRHVAVKVLKNDEGDSSKIAQATLAEARALAAINHPNVVHVHTIGIRHGQPYIVMELLVGSGKLNVMLKEGWVADEQRGLEIAIDVAQGLKAAHGAGLLHRDVKPGNILFNNEGVAKLLDFSVVHATNGDGEKLVIGTPYYIAPEAARGNDVDFRADIYSLGATLFHLLAGRPVFDGETARDVMRARLKQKAPDVREFKPLISPHTAQVLARMLETDAGDRYGSYDELIADLRLSLDQLGQAAAADVGGIADFEQVVAAQATAPVAMPRRRTAPPPPVKSSSSKQWVMGLVAAGVAVVVVIIFLVKGSGTEEKDRVATADGKSNPIPYKPRPEPPVNKDGGATPAPDPDKDKQVPTPPITPDPVTPVTPVTPQPPKEDPVIAAMKAWESTVAAQLKREPTAWQPIVWTSLRSEGGATLTPQTDGSVLVGGANPPTDRYVLDLKLAVAPEQITGLWLEALPDPSLTEGGPGRSTKGNFVLSRVTAQVLSLADPRSVRAVQFATPVADFEQVNFPVAGTLDDNDQSGWAILPRTNQPSAALFPISAISAAVPAPKRAPIVFDNFEGAKLAEHWTVTGSAFKDRPYKDGDIVFPGGLTGFEGKQMANSALGTGLGVSNPDNKRGTGTLISKPIKIERDTLSFLLAGGDKETTRVQLKIDGNVIHKASGDRSLKLKKTAWDLRPFAGKDAVLEIIDEEDKDSRGFIIVDQIELTDEPAGGAEAGKGHMLRLVLAHQSSHPQHGLGRFRVSLTTSKDPFLPAQLPDNIKSIVAAGGAGRTAEQARELEAFYRRTKVDGLPYIPPGGVAQITPKPVTPTPATPTTPVTPVTPTKAEPAPKLDAYKSIELAKLADKRIYGAPEDAIVLIPRNSQWVYWARSETPDAKWAAADFVASGWSLDDAPFGYGLYETKTMLKDMKGKFDSIYARAPFHVDDPAKLGELSVVGRFDDAVIVYINGHAVFRSPALTGAGKTAKVGQPVAKSNVVTLDLKDGKKHLKAGVNVIAIECHNAALDDADFALDPALIAEAPVVPKQAAAGNKREGWTGVECKLSFDKEGLYVESSGANPRIETGDIKIDFDDRPGKVKLIIKIKAETAGALKLDWASKPKAAKNAVPDSEHRQVRATTQLVTIVIEKITVSGKLEKLAIHLPKGTTMIQSIHVVLEKDPSKVLESWVFGKD